MCRSGDKVPPDKGKGAVIADNIDGIIERIKKAVRLANKTTEAGERETAMRLAKNLAEKNGIAFDEIAVDEESVCKAQRAQDDAASLYHGYMSADRVSLNRPCVNGAPKAGELQERRQIGRRV